jgi:hypothetical protein
MQCSRSDGGWQAELVRGCETLIDIGFARAPKQ